MKKIFILFFLLAAAPLFAQITLEHTYDTLNTGALSYSAMELVRLDSNEVKYLHYKSDGFELFNIDHTLYKFIQWPTQLSVTTAFCTRHLFNLDDKIEYLLESSVNGAVRVSIYNEDGDRLFFKDSCRILGGFVDNSASSYLPIINTDRGTKMILRLSNYQNTFVYSLPGKLPICTTKLAVSDDPSITISGGGYPTSAYPNPTNGKVRIEYKLPIGVTGGEIVLTTSGGVEVKRYRVTDTFNDILIERSDLVSGSYFYRLITEKGESDAKRLVVTK